MPDLVKFMEMSPLQLRNGLFVIERFPEELKKTNRIKHGLKIKIREDLLRYCDLMFKVF